MSEQITKQAIESITNRDYLSGKETRYYVLTIKLDSIHYHVIVLEHNSVIISSEIKGRLDRAKKEGIRLLIQKNPSVDIRDITMVHYKHDRPNGRAWQKDSEKVLKQLLALENTVSIKNINYAFLDDALKKFSNYRKNHEEDYQADERQFKIEIVSEIGSILRKLETESRNAIDQLIEGFSGLDKNNNIRKNLQILFKGSIWLDDFLVFLQHSEQHIIVRLLQDLFDQGITEEIRIRFGEQYQALLVAGKFTDSKKKVETPNQLLAVLLAAYSSDEYVFYKPNDFGPFVDRMGLIAPNDVVERYALYNQVSHMILAYAKDKGYKVQDLIDAYHVVYFNDKYAEVTGGSAADM
ncbi:hypothetical protein [Paenibacillus sp. LHD-38]|uniref:hypothetical protein n=1 Tax=Paenibacillus sp. LHD-38 TaxID=3072143 RepID=UPI00280F3007|nr:hypothetical protein [Paenibacillus sp. LHD-38]MDQ8733978.1 hypothetical protein [Paenibacillus sp. LHD-38]